MVYHRDVKALFAMTAMHAHHLLLLVRKEKQQQQHHETRKKRWLDQTMHSPACEKYFTGHGLNLKQRGFLDLPIILRGTFCVPDALGYVA